MKNTIRTTSQFVRRRRLLVATTAMLSFAALFTSTSVHAALPTSGNGWTLTETGGGSWILNDSIDSNKGWSADPSGTATWFTASESTPTYGNLAPTAGNSFYYYNRSSAGGIVKYFDDAITIQVGTYTVSFEVGNISSAPSTNAARLPYSAHLTQYTSSSTSAYSSRVGGRTVVSSSTPTAGNWVTLTYSWVIEDGNVAIGKTLGFMIQDSSAGSFAIDNLVITYTAPIPEPATFALILGAATLAVYTVVGRIRRNSQGTCIKG